MGIHTVVATPADAAQLADVAAATFPLACPPSATAENIAAFIAANLSEERFSEYLRDDRRVILVARDDDGRPVGYSLLIHEAGGGIELSKMYVLADRHGGGVAAALMAATLDRARQLGAATVWLGVNQQNQRAQRFYGKHGFIVTGTKTFQLGDGVEHDFVMTVTL